MSQSLTHQLASPGTRSSEDFLVPAGGDAAGMALANFRARAVANFGARAVGHQLEYTCTCTHASRCTHASSCAHAYTESCTHLCTHTKIMHTYGHAYTYTCISRAVTRMHESVTYSHINMHVNYTDMHVRVPTQKQTHVPVCMHVCNLGKKR